MGIRYSALPGHTTEMSEAMDEALSKKWRELRGIAIASFAVATVSAPEEDEQMIKHLQKKAVYRDPSMAAASLVGAQGEAMVGTAKNTGAGPVMAFAGMNMAQNAGGLNAGDLFAMGQQRQQQAAAANSWTCSCGAQNTGAFCQQCGAKKPAPAEPAANGWTCSCGVKNTGAFCTECGAKKPAGAKLYRCDKCGWEPEDPAHPPKFCPECGDPFDDNDARS